MLKLRLSSIVMRQALTSTMVMLVAIGLLTLAATITIRDQEHANLLRTVDADIAGLTDVMVQGGVTELARRIADRTDLASQIDPLAAYYLGTADGQKIAGNLSTMPPVDAAHSQSRSIDMPDGPMVVRATRLRGGLTLVVGRSLAPATFLVRRLQVVLLAISLPAILASMGAAVIVTSRFRNRVAMLNDVFARFDEGALSARANADFGRDELSDLGVHVDGHLDRIEDLLKAQREISDNIAHELRTPLVHLDMRLLRALDHATDNSISAELSDARDDIRSIVSLFDSLLDITLAEAKGDISGEATPFDVSELAANLAELYAASAEEAGLDFSTRIAPGITMRGEPMAITRMVANLLDNAFKYVPQGSRVRLIVSAGPRIIVEDDGPGIVDIDRDQIFKRFHRVKTSGQGHGLGLALVRIIAARHGLTSTFEDASPGARFVVDRVDQK